MPLFKFSYLDHTFNHAWLGLERSIQFDFLAEHVLDSSEFYLELPLAFEFETIEVPPLELPLPEFFFDATDRTVDYAEIQFAITVLQALLSDTAELPVELELNLPIHVTPDLIVSAPEFNVANLNLSRFMAVPEFEVYAPIIVDFTVELPRLEAEILTFEPVLGSMTLPAPKTIFSLQAIFGETASLLMEIGSLEFLFSVYEQEHFAQLDLEIPSPGFRLDAATASTVVDDYIIKFYYLSWMLEMLKSVSPEDADDLVIRFKG